MIENRWDDIIRSSRRVSISNWYQRRKIKRNCRNYFHEKEIALLDEV